MPEPDADASLPAAPRWRQAVLPLLAAVLVGAAAWIGGALSERRGLEALREDLGHRLDLFSAAVQSAVTRLEDVPATLQLNPDVLALLRSPQAAGARRVVREYLFRLNAHVGGGAIFVVDVRGQTLASSNTRVDDDSLPSADVSFRPYFTEALSGRVGRHFALAPLGGRPAYYVSHPIHDGAQVIGVAVTQIALDGVDQAWAMLGSPALLADGRSVVILSSRPEWLYTTLAPLPLDDLVDLRLTRQFGPRALSRFPLELTLHEHPETLALEGRSRGAAGRGASLVMGRPLNGIDWRVLIFEDLSPVRHQAQRDGALAAALAALVLLALALQQRIRRQRARHKALLEHMVEQRTRTLREAQDELVQAAKLAVIGQLATGITHELTQPLGAIRTLTDNAAEFLRRGQPQAASDNLAIVGRLVGQMGAIVQPLKSFARKSPPRPAAVDPAHAVANALVLFSNRLKRERVEVQQQLVPGRFLAWCDRNRLEQVLINLIGNALDAMRDSPWPRLELRAEVAPGPIAGGAPALRLDVIDSGPGLPPETLARLFTPFFTTKPEGAGLGLGLAISRDIVREFGGELLADNAPGGGARFTLWLPPMPEPAAER